MSETSPLSEQERADLVAYLDGELTDESARAMEAKLSLNPEARAEADALKRTWDLLDFLPQAEPSPNFTHRTLSRLTPIQPTEAVPSAPVAPRHPRRWLSRVGVLCVWLIVVTASALAGYAGYQRLVPREPGERELVRELRLIENKRYYDAVGDIEFLRQLDHPELFGDDSGR
jgi:anti-sigma factor RsiW